MTGGECWRLTNGAKVQFGASSRMYELVGTSMRRSVCLEADQLCEQAAVGTTTMMMMMRMITMSPKSLSLLEVAH